MKRHFLIIAASIIAMVVQSCSIAISGESLGGETVKGNGNIVTRNCDVSVFEGLSLLLPATVNFTISEDYTCTFRVDENYWLSLTEGMPISEAKTILFETENVLSKKTDKAEILKAKAGL